MKRYSTPELRRNDFEEIRQGLLRDYGKETVLEKMLKRAPDRLLSARMDELMGAALPRSSRKLSLEQMEGLNLDSIAAFYQKLYTRPEGTTYVIAAISIRTVSCASLYRYSDVFLLHRLRQNTRILLLNFLRPST